MIKITRLKYRGWPNAYRITDDRVELIILTDVGPRIIRYGFVGGENQFVELPEQTGLTGGDEWRLYGGHRLWHSPESLTRTYYADNHPVEVIVRENGLVLVQQKESSTNLQKSMEVEMDSETGAVTIIHHIKNRSLWNIRLSAWAISAMAPGGLSIVKQRTHNSKDICTPDMRISVWPRTSINDKRVIWGDEFILLQQDINVEKTFKIGVSSDVGWIAHANGHHLFAKYYDYDSKSEYPDFGSSVELYTCGRFSEIETLSPISEIMPDQEITHRERWQLFGIDKSQNQLFHEEVLNSYIVPLVTGHSLP